MTNDTPTTADVATEAAIDAHISGNAEKAAPLFNRATVEHQRAAAAAAPNDSAWRDEAALAPMPEAPMVERTEVDNVIAKLTDFGGDHAALVQEWESTGANVGEEIGYARAAYKSIVANDPGLIAAVDASGLGDHPAVLKFLSKQGRLDAGFSGDFTIARNNMSNEQPAFTNRSVPSGPSGSNRGSEETRSELARMMAANPPGSMSYKDLHVQNRIQQLHRTLAGTGNVVGRGGRTA